MKFLIFIFPVLLFACSSTVPYYRDVVAHKYDTREIFLRKHLADYRGKSVCFITNASGLGRYMLWKSAANQNLLLDLLRAENIHVPKIFTPEHGLTGMEEDSGNQYIKGSEIITIYNSHSQNEERYVDHFRECNALVFDLPDAGVRPYTYRSVMTMSMRAAAQSGSRFILLDSPNPATILGIAGPVVARENFSVLGEEEIPFFPYYTYGELALYYKNKNALSLYLQIIEMQDYKPGRHYQFTSTSYLPPSPNLPDFRAIECYWIGIFLEGIQMDEGRASKDPFCTVGHPDFMAGKAPPGNKAVSYEPFSYPALHGPFRGRLLNGFRIEVHDPEKYDPMKSGYELIAYILREYPQKKWFKKWSSGNYALDLLTGSDSMRLALENGASYELWNDSHEAARKKFEKEMDCCELY